MKITIDTNKDSPEAIEKAIELIKIEKARPKKKEKSIGVEDKDKPYIHSVIDKDSAKVIVDVALNGGLKHIIRTISKEKAPIPISILRGEFLSRGLTNEEFEDTVERLKMRGDIIEPKNGYIQLAEDKSISIKDTKKHKESPKHNTITETEKHMIKVCKTHLFGALLTMTKREFPTFSTLFDEFDMIEYDEESTPFPDRIPGYSKQSNVIIITEQELIKKATETLARARYPDIAPKIMTAALNQLPGPHSFGPYMFAVESSGIEGKRFFSAVF